MRTTRTLRRLSAVAATVTLVLFPITARADAAPAPADSSQAASVADFHGLSSAQRADLRGIARDTWKFYAQDVDPTTHLPLDNITYAGGSATPTSFGRYTSASNVGVYLWAVVAANDMGLISRAEADHRITQTLTTVRHLKRDHGFLLQWYDTTNGHVIRNPGDIDCTTEPTPTFDNCFFVSNVDNGWYASGLVVARRALPELHPLLDDLLGAMDFGQFYDARAETHCNLNPAIPGNQPTGQMFGGYFLGLPPDQGTNWQHYFHYGAFYSDPRISAYIGMGLHQMPGNVWWRSWRTLPPPAPFADCATDPDFSWQGQWPTPGSWQTFTDPQSGQKFPVWEGHYNYLGSDLKFIPTFGGGMFEGLMANEVVPETSWGTTSFGRNDVNTVQVQIKYTAEQLHLPVWGMSPSSTPDDSGGYSGYGVSGQKFPYFGVGATADHPNLRLAQCDNCSPEDVVTPHASFIALDAAPAQAFANIERLRTQFPGVYSGTGFFDSVNPATGSVGHRQLVLDQSMIMAALDNALENRAMQRHFASDPISQVARTYLGLEHFAIG